MAGWTAFPQAGEFAYDTQSVQRHWARLHAGDAEPLPREPEVLRAWVLFHNGHFEQAASEGLAAGGAGVTVANKATSLYANYLEANEARRLELLREAASRAEEQAAREPSNPNAWYWMAYALGRYSQGVSVARALAQGLGGKVKEALERTIRLQPRHADAHVALGTFHAEVIDKVGVLIGGMTYGAKRETGLLLFRQGLEIHPESAIGMVEQANGLLMLEGDERQDEATQLYERAARVQPMDAAERLGVALAQAELQEQG